MNGMVPEAIETYAQSRTSPLPPLLEELVAGTQERFPERMSMLSGATVGTLLQVLAHAVRARRILEIGTFTGFSALMMAAALPDDGELVTCDRNAKALAVAREFFARSPHGGKIQIRDGDALETLHSLAGPFDLVFIDADKERYVEYYEAALPLLAPHGLIVADNALWYGRVLDPQNDSDRAVVAFNDHVQRDPRVVNALLTVRDGLMLIQRA